jgi:hypothetical protein
MWVRCKLPKKSRVTIVLLYEVPGSVYESRGKDNYVDEVTLTSTRIPITAYAVQHMIRDCSAFPAKIFIVGQEKSSESLPLLFRSKGLYSQHFFAACKWVGDISPGPPQLSS